MKNKIIKTLLYKHTKLYSTYKEVNDVFTEPELIFFSCPWVKSPLLPVWRRGPIISLARHEEYDDTPGKYAAWAKYTTWNNNFLKRQNWWGRTWRKVIRPHYQLPIWLSFGVWNRKESVKSKWDYFSYEFPPQFSIIFFGWSLNWILTAPSATTDYVSEKTGKSSPDNDAYWESIYNYLYQKGDNKLYNAIDSICTTMENEKKIAWLQCRPEYIKLNHSSEYFKEAEKIKNNEKYKDCIWK